MIKLLQPRSHCYETAMQCDLTHFPIAALGLAISHTLLKKLRSLAQQYKQVIST
ncbi:MULTISPECIES: hypothetical protein [Spirulina sp. CCY15215]|uniref:hypothetical protein n=1 Tax=Spirulina sp. CCY15215 TaxID=2767591 RepID=UPI001951EEC6|nr:hypothetical protein [Spirulina major]